MTLSEVLPSLAKAGVARSFDSTVWPAGTVMSGDDVLVGGVPADRLVGSPMHDGVLATRVRRMVRSGPVVTCEIEGALPPHCTLADVAWPGAHLAGARMRQLLVRAADGTRIAGRVEVPCDVAWEAVIVLALAVPVASASPALRSWCVECDEDAGDIRWTVWTSDDTRSSHDGGGKRRREDRVHSGLERLA